MSFPVHHLLLIGLQGCGLKHAAASDVANVPGICLRRGTKPNPLAAFSQMQPPVSAGTNFGAAAGHRLAPGSAPPVPLSSSAAQLLPQAVGPPRAPPVTMSTAPPNTAAPIYVLPAFLQPPVGGTTAPQLRPPVASAAAAGFVGGPRPPVSHAPGVAPMNGASPYLALQRPSSAGVRGLAQYMPNPEAYPIGSSASAAQPATGQPARFLGRADLAAPTQSATPPRYSWVLPSSAAPAASSAAAAPVPAHLHAPLGALPPQQPKPAQQPQAPSQGHEPASALQQNGVHPAGQSGSMVDAQLST